jgi:hypothetical protein
MVGITIQNHKLTKEQYLKLFSNPVSGIACDMNGAGTNYDYAHMGRFHLKNIRYSKSMILKALYFWEKQYDRYNYLLKRAQFNPLFGNKNNKENEILKLIMMVHNLPDTFLFSHRHIEIKTKKYNNSMNTQLELLNKKYPYLKVNCKEYGFQENTLQPVFKLTMDVGIEFTVFPYEHPYIEKQKITRVGMTDKGNVFVLHKAKKK